MMRAHIAPSTYVPIMKLWEILQESNINYIPKKLIQRLKIESKTEQQPISGLPRIKRITRMLYIANAL